MNPHLRDRILRKLDTLSDERGYQVLDFAEFLESRYAEKPSTAGSAFTRFAEAVEDRMRSGGVSVSTITEAMGLMNRAANVLNSAVAAGRSMASELVNSPPSSAPRAGTEPPARSDGGTGSATAGAGNVEASQSPPASNVAGSTQAPGSGGEKL